MIKIYQVNICEKVNGEKYANVTSFGEDGYKGVTIDCTYEDGCDQTNWGVYAGTLEACNEVKNILNSVYEWDETHKFYGERKVRLLTENMFIEAETPSEAIKRALDAGILRFSENGEVEFLNERSSWGKCVIKYRSQGPESWWKHNCIFCEPTK